MTKVIAPRTYPGMSEKNSREFYLWMISVCDAIGVAPPTSLEQLGEQSVIPILSQIRDTNRRIEEMERKFSSVAKENNELRRRIDDLERSI